MSNKRVYDINFYDLKDKKQNTKDMVEYQLDRTLSMFKWKNLPKTIPERSLELYLQTNGFVLLTKHNDEYCIYYGGLGGEPDYLYRPTIATIANPAQRFDAQLKIAWEVDEDTPEDAAVICINDPLLKGLLPIHQKYASQLAENELTLWLTDILTRMPWLLSAQDDKTKKSAELLLSNIFEGKLGVVTDSAFLDGIKEHVLNNSNHQSLAALMQLHQYYKASWFNEVGLNAMQNQFKKEAISDSEQQMNTDTLTPLIDIMLANREDFCERVNQLYGLDISVELNSAWKDNEIEEEASIEAVAEGETNTELSENEIEETSNEETTDEETLNDNEEQSEEETTENTDIKVVEETFENFEEKLDEVIEAVDELKGEEEETEDEDSTT